MALVSSSVTWTKSRIHSKWGERDFRSVILTILRVEIRSFIHQSTYCEITHGQFSNSNISNGVIYMSECYLKVWRKANSPFYTVYSLESVTRFNLTLSLLNFKIWPRKWFSISLITKLRAVCLFGYLSISASSITHIHLLAVVNAVLKAVFV